MTLLKYIIMHSKDKDSNSTKSIYVKSFGANLKWTVFYAFFGWKPNLKAILYEGVSFFYCLNIWFVSLLIVSKINQGFELHIS